MSWRNFSHEIACAHIHRSTILMQINMSNHCLFAGIYRIIVSLALFRIMVPSQCSHLSGGLLINDVTGFYLTNFVNYSKRFICFAVLLITWICVGQLPGIHAQVHLHFHLLLHLFHRPQFPHQVICFIRICNFQLHMKYFLFLLAYIGISLP